MGKTNWTLEQLKSELSRYKEIRSWTIQDEFLHRCERYFLNEGNRVGIDQDRNVHKRTISLKISVDIGQPGRQGEMSKKLFTALPLQEQIRSAVTAAMDTSFPQWNLPESLPSELPTILSADPRIGEDINQVMYSLTQDIEKNAFKQNHAFFNSSELFVSFYERELHLSNGFKHRSTQSRIYCEAAFSSSKESPQGSTIADEFLSSRWSVDTDGIAIQDLFLNASANAIHSTDVHMPRTGKYSVIIDAEVISTLLNNSTNWLLASNSYHQLPFLSPGSNYIPNAEGDLISISLNPLLQFGAASAVVSEQGFSQSRLKLVDNNKVVSTITDMQYGEYLHLKPTSTMGNLEVGAGSQSYESLTKAAPQVIEILQFSGLFMDPSSGTFSSEIRLGRLYDNETGKITYIKGGSLSGSLKENFAGLRLTDQIVTHSHFTNDQQFGHGYRGPSHALLTNVSIVG